MKISIITPSFNQGQFIEDAIMSVLEQKYEDFEHIIIDAGSTDETIDILKKYPHLKWVSEPDKGQSDALNKGFRRAKGDILGWLNADDFFEENAFSTIVKICKEKPEVDFFYSNYFWVDKNKNILKVISPYKRYSYFLNLLYGCYIPTSGSFFFKSFFEKAGELDINFRYKMDTDIFERSKKVKFYKINNVLSGFRFHDDNVSFRDKNVSSGVTKQDMESIIIKDRFFNFKFSSEKKKLIYKVLWYPSRLIYLFLKYTRL